MFLVAGINSKVSDCGIAPNGACPVCGSTGMLHVSHKYMTPHVFFIPTFRFHSTYIVTCASCASVMGLDTGKGKAVEKGRPVQILPQDLEVLQDNRVPACARCGGRLPQGSAFCPHCGERL